MPHRIQVMANLVILEKGNEQMWGAGVQGNSGNSVKPIWQQETNSRMSNVHNATLERELRPQ